MKKKLMIIVAVVSVAWLTLVLVALVTALVGGLNNPPQTNPNPNQKKETRDWVKANREHGISLTKKQERLIKGQSPKVIVTFTSPITPMMLKKYLREKWKMWSVTFEPNESDAQKRKSRCEDTCKKSGKRGEYSEHRYKERDWVANSFMHFRKCTCR